MDNKKDISDTNGFAVMCGIMYFASMVYVYNRHLKIFGYFILVFIFAVSWIFIVKNGNEYFAGFMNTQLYQMINANSYGIYILYFVYLLALLSVILNSYGIGTVLKSYMDRIAQVKSYDLNLGQYQRDNLFIFNTGFYASTLLLIGLIYSFSFWIKTDTGITNLSMTSYAQIFVFIVSIVASIFVAIYSTKFKSVKNDSLPKTNTRIQNIKGQTKFSDLSYGMSRTPQKTQSINGIDLLKNVNQLTPIRLAEINQLSDVTIKSYQNLIIPEGQVLTIASGKTLTIEGLVTNNGSVVNNGTVSNNGIITNYGIINTSKTISGTINNSGIINDSSVIQIPLTNVATLNENTYTLNGDFTIPSGKTITIPSGKTLIIPSGKTLTNSGTIQNDGTYSGAAPNPKGTITGTNAAQIP